MLYKFRKFLRGRNMNSNYVLWSFEDIPNALKTYNLIGLKNAEELWNLISGEPFLETLVDQLEFTANPDSPNDLLLIDNVGNTESLFPVSPTLKSFINNKNLPDIEFIPVNILDHRENVAGKYFLLHPLKSVDCIDKEASNVRVDRLNEEMFNRVRKLVINENNIPDQKSIFRIKGLYNAVAVDRSLAEELSSQKFIGLDWIEIDEYSY